MSRRLGTTLEMIKWEHSVFALPFALTGAMLAAGGLPPWRVLFWIVVCMIAARSAAMAFNRWADAEIDRVNPRTATRAIPAGLLSRQFTIGFTIVSTAIFLVAASRLNRLTLELAPLALAVIFFYSYAKRFSHWSHLASMCCMPARITSTICRPGCIVFRRRLGCGPRFGLRAPCTWPCCCYW